MQDQALCDFIVDKLDDSKAVDIQVLNVSEKSSITDYMVVCSGNSNRHVNAIADHVSVSAKAADLTLLSTQGRDTGEWVIVDLGDLIVHIMQEETRDFYQLEKLWGGQPQGAQA